MAAPAGDEEIDMLEHVHLLREIGAALFENIPSEHKAIGMGEGPCSVAFKMPAYSNLFLPTPGYPTNLCSFAGQMHCSPG